MLAYSLIVNMYQYVTLSGAKHTFFVCLDTETYNMDVLTTFNHKLYCVFTAKNIQFVPIHLNIVNMSILHITVYFVYENISMYVW